MKTMKITRRNLCAQWQGFVTYDKQLATGHKDRSLMALSNRLILFLETGIVSLQFLK